MDNTYFASVIGASGGGFFECYKDYTQRTQLVISPPNDTPLSARIAQTADGTHWTSKYLATCETPEVHSLPLNIAGDDSTCYYAKDQFGRVYVSIRTNLNANWNDYKIIGTLPEGFQPVWDVVTPLLIQNDPISYQIGQIVIQPGGNIYVHGSFTSAEYIFAQLTYPASV